MSDNENLPSLISRASQRLLNAKSSAEVMEAKQIAEAALHYAKVTKAANDTHADCLRIITRAEIRMADEYEAGQQGGEVRTRADNQHVRDADKLSLDDLGISRQRVSEWRETRDAGPEVVEQAIQGALAEGRAPTKSDIKKHIRGTFGTGENEWYTPSEYIEMAREVLGRIDLDPASSDAAQEVVMAEAHFTEQNDGLSQDWNGLVWLNPPYAQPHITNFVAKMVEERRSGRVIAAIMLTHNYTDTAWFHEAANTADAICFTRGRVKFYNADGNVAAPTQGQAFFYFGNNVVSFASVFQRAGIVLIPETGEIDD